MSLSALMFTSFLTALIHTAAGPDHYLPFIALGKSRNWSISKTTIITVVAGLGHVLSSVLIGLFGLLLSIKLNWLEKVESVRGEFVAWFLMIFGLVYLVWGIKAAANHTHKTFEPKSNSFIGWTLFIIFAFGPCEPLIPILMFPAASYGIGASLLVAMVFLVVTVGLMLVIVLTGLFGLKFIPNKFHRMGHAMAGSVVLLCGVAIQMGL